LQHYKKRVFKEGSLSRDKKERWIMPGLGY
jgi:hypothetical protein